MKKKSKNNDKRKETQHRETLGKEGERGKRAVH